MKRYLAAAALVAVCVCLWLSGRHYGLSELDQALRTQDAVDMAACRDAWSRWGH